MSNRYIKYKACQRLERTMEFVFRPRYHNESVEAYREELQLYAEDQGVHDDHWIVESEGDLKVRLENGDTFIWGADPKAEKTVEAA